MEEIFLYGSVGTPSHRGPQCSVYNGNKETYTSQHTQQHLVFHVRNILLCFHQHVFFTIYYPAFGAYSPYLLFNSEGICRLLSVTLLKIQFLLDIVSLEQSQW